MKAPRTRRDGRGFTLVELAVVLVVASIVFYMLAQWVISLISDSNRSLDHGKVNRDVTYVATRLSADLTQATTCSGAPALLPSNATQLSLYIHANTPAGPDQTEIVTWAFSGSTLTRTDTSLEPHTCTPATPDPARVMATGVSDGAFSYTTAGTASDNCPDLDETGQPIPGAECGADSVSLAMTAHQPSPATTTAHLNQTWALTQGARP